MCGRYTLHSSPERIKEHFHLQHSQEIAAHFNIAPSQWIPAVRQGPQGRELIKLRWGLIPSWSKEEKTAYSMINARAETVATKPAFRSAFRSRRCLIPADGFYEWKTTAGRKQPYYIRRRDSELFAFAGLWERWEGEGGKYIESSTIIVTVANPLLQSIHDRMPVILKPADYERWLDPKVQEAETLISLLHPYPAEEMELYPVSRKVNSPANDNPDCIAPLTE
jgi:putative SOS response-associated peptidase YedK